MHCHNHFNLSLLKYLLSLQCVSGSMLGIRNNSGERDQKSFQPHRTSIGNIRKTHTQNNTCVKINTYCGWVLSLSILSCNLSHSMKFGWTWFPPYPQVHTWTGGMFGLCMYTLLFSWIHWNFSRITNCRDKDCWFPSLLPCRESLPHNGASTQREHCCRSKGEEETSSYYLSPQIEQGLEPENLRAFLLK